MTIKKYVEYFFVLIFLIIFNPLLTFSDDAVPAVVLNKEIQLHSDQVSVDLPEKKLPTLQNLNRLCADTYKQSAACPKEYCKLFCLEGESGEACTLDCEPRPCVELDVDYCPTDVCQVIDGCADKTKICYPKLLVEPTACGSLSYSGALDCCKGFVKRCGVEFLDGSCDMRADYTVDSAPQCIPCGNGICNQFENRCNCPEDCSKK